MDEAPNLILDQTCLVNRGEAEFSLFFHRGRFGVFGVVSVPMFGILRFPDTFGHREMKKCQKQWRKNTVESIEVLWTFACFKTKHFRHCSQNRINSLEQ